MYPVKRGTTARQAHVQVPEGTFEEEHGRDAFSGSASHLYRTHPPTSWTEIDGPLRPHAFDLVRPEVAARASQEWQRLMHNRHSALYVFAPTAPPASYLRNADGDTVYFTHRGVGVFETDYGDLPFEPGDYVIVPKGTTHRPVPQEGSAHFLVIETSAEVGLPDRGLLGQHALFDPAVMVLPELPAGPRPDGTYHVRVKRGGLYTTLTYPFHPLDVVGWRGTLCVRKLNVRDFRPITSPRYHLPPSAHATFVAEGLSICTFAPRPLEGPETLKVPFYHANIDNDEILFYHSGEFFSRAGIGEGLMTLHPQGLHHGPQPGAVKRSGDKTETAEVAVMVEAEDPYELTPFADLADIPEYVNSWKEAQAEAAGAGGAR
ncbi:MAG: homogentisate 1,2-dioxygenase [Candidatus Dormibacteria bacterium]